MRNYEYIACEICGSNDLDLIYKGKGKDNQLVHVCVCETCGFCFLNPRWTEASYLDYYKHDYNKFYRNKPVFLEPERDLGSYHPLYLRLQESFKDFSPKKVLDIGSGDGSKLEYLKQKYPEATYFALEPAASYKEKIENRGIQFVSDDVNSDWDISYKDTFDLIILRHTLEHFLSPKLVLEKINRVLSDSGMVYIAVPDGLYVDTPILRSFFRVVHAYYYNKISLKNILSKNRFEVLLMECGDKYHPFEIFTFAKKSNKKEALVIDASNYKKQKEELLKHIKKEQSILYKFVLLKDWLVKVKKIFFPKPILRKRILK